MNIGNLVSGIIVIVLGALILADGILDVIPEVGMTLFFTGVNPYFKIAVGLIALILGGSLIDKNEKNNV